jgi:DNA-directed RNA polymerase III subunit RPC1
VDDVRPGAKLSDRKESLVERGYANCESFIRQFRNKELQLAPGCTADETLEVRRRALLFRMRPWVCVCAWSTMLVLLS